MKKILTIFVVLILFTTTYAQNSNLFKKSELKKAIHVEVVDISGQTNQGHLWYADSSVLVISKNNLIGDSLFALNPNEIYSIKMKTKEGFVRTTLKYMTLTGLVGASQFFFAENSMIGPGAFFVIFSIFPGAPIGLTSGLLFKNLPKENINYVTEASDSAYQIILPYTNKKIPEYRSANNTNELNPVYNNNVVNSFDAPKLSRHPLNQSKFHISAGMGLLLTNPMFSADKSLNATNYDLANSDPLLLYSRIENYPVNINFKYNINNKTRLYSSISFIGKYKTFASDEYNQDTTTNATHYLTSRVKPIFFTTGAEYVINPVNNMMLHRFEFTFGAGFTASYIKSENRVYGTVFRWDGIEGVQTRVDESVIDNKIALGVNFNTGVNYYLNKYSSINIEFSTYGLSNVATQSVSATDILNREITLPAYNLNLSSVFVNFGFQIHF